MSQSPPQHSPLAHLPVSMFSIVMGLAGTALACARVESLLTWQASLSLLFRGLATLVFALILLAYLLKFLRHRQQVLEEFEHPVRISFFPTMSISAILLSLVYLPVHAQLAEAIWLLGCLVQLLFTLAILSAWMHADRYQVQHSNPAWFIPIVGNILIPAAGVPLGYPQLSWFFFSIGLVMWLPLLAVLLNRFFFHPMLPAKLLPTLFILIAPPAVGFVSWMQLNHGQVDASIYHTKPIDRLSGVTTHPASASAAA